MKKGRRIRGIMGRGLIRLRQNALQKTRQQQQSAPTGDQVQEELLDLQAELWREQDDLARRKSQVSLPHMVFRWFKKRRQAPSEGPDPVPADDPVRAILAVPRGPSRLEAFATTLTTLAPGSHGHRGVALAFHRELLALADAAQIDLSLIASRVEACANALVDTGEEELAGVLLSKIGKKHRAAELFVATGAVDKLLAAHHDIDQKEGGQRVAAAMAFDRFEALFLVGQRRHAFASLREAARLWPENLAYKEVLSGFEARLLPPNQLCLRRGELSFAITNAWPVQVGRGEESALTVRSPLLSRRHLELTRHGGQIVLGDLSGRDDIRLNGTPLRQLGALPALSEQDEISLGGVVLDCLRSSTALVISAKERPEARLVAVVQSPFSVAPKPNFQLAFDAVDGRANLIAGATLRLNAEDLRTDRMLLRDDRIEANGTLWLVA